MSKIYLTILVFNFLWNSENVTKAHLAKVIERLHDQYYQQWNTEVTNSPKLSTYNLIKGDQFNFQNYLDCANIDNYRTALFILRCSAHKLAIEEGKFRNIPRNERKCIFCQINVIEDEYNFILVCPLLYRDIRREYVPSYNCDWSTANKFHLSSNLSSLLNEVAKYVNYATLSRESVLGK